ncbi:MAG: ATP cone domain-containing protein [Candidatus Nanoarchaeia archaeon]
MNMKVRKRDGFVVDFDESKVVNSLKSSGVSDETIEKVLLNIYEKKFSIISTDKLYGMIYDLVKKLENKYSASIYSLKNAILRLGPDGYSFEDFIGKIFTFLGYKVKVRQIYSSLCITHELDVVGADFFIECKYHNSGGINTGIKDVMYSHARFLDLKNANKKKGYNFTNFWVVSNTKFSEDSIDYAKYWKINLMSWKYKGNMSLSYLIDRNALYPITLLPSVSKRVFEILNKNSILIISEVCYKDNNDLKRMGLNDNEIRNLKLDCENLINASKKIKKEDY